MRKEELKQDPIQDKIVALVETILSNKIAIFTGVILFSIIISLISYFQYNNKLNNEQASFILSKAQKELNNGNDSLGMAELNKLLIDFKSTDFDDMSKVYFVAQEYDSTSNVNDPLSYLDNISNINDSYLKSFLYSVKGDLSMNVEDYKEASRMYQKAYDLVNSPFYCEKLSLSLIKLKDYKKVISLTESILKDDKLYGLKRKFEEYLVIAKSMQNKSL